MGSLGGQGGGVGFGSILWFVVIERRTATGDRT